MLTPTPTLSKFNCNSQLKKRKEIILKLKSKNKSYHTCLAIFTSVAGNTKADVPMYTISAILPIWTRITSTIWKYKSEK